MPVIDAEGLFNGDRFDLMSDEARVFWPHFWCASNSVGRLELNYHKVIGDAFRRWQTPPSEAKFWDLIQQYRDAYLLFVYEHRGQLWGQWDTSEKNLPRHKKTSDLATPAPFVRDFTEWQNAYIEIKRSKSISINNFGNLSGDLRTNVRGVGVGVGVGGGKAEGEDGAPLPELPKNIADSAAAAGIPRKKVEQMRSLVDRLNERGRKWLAIFPNQIDLDKAAQEYISLIGTEALADAADAGLQRYIASGEWRDLNGNLIASKARSPLYFLRDLKFNDNPAPFKPRDGPKSSKAEEYPTYIPPVIPDDEDARV